MILGLLACLDYGLDGPDSKGSPGEDHTGDSAADTEPLTCPDGVPAPGTVGLDDTCHGTPETAPIEVVVAWEVSSWSTTPGSDESMMTPVVGRLTDVNADGRLDDEDPPDIVCVTYDWPSIDSTMLRVNAGVDGAERWSQPIEAGGTDGLAMASIADLDGDGWPEVLVATNETLFAFAHDGTPLWSTSTAGGVLATHTTPAVADLDGDGRAEIIVGRTIVEADGTRITTGVGSFGGENGGAGTTSFPVDLDQDGAMEIVAGETLYDAGMFTIWDRGGNGGFVAVADLDLDGVPTILESMDGIVYAINLDGSTLWEAALGSYGVGPPTVADFDGDGLPEIAVSGATQTWALGGDGTVLWEAATRDASSYQTGSAAFDFDADGAYELVYADETRLWILAGVDGSVRAEVEGHSSATQIESAVVADVDNDGHAEIVAANNRYGPTPSAGLIVYQERLDRWPEAPPIWNQYAWHRTNIGEDASLPWPEAASWLDRNDFRATSGPDSPVGVGLLADVQVRITDVCSIECEAGLARAWVEVANSGLADAADVVVVLTGGGAHLGDASVGTLPRGATQTFVFDLVGDALTATDLTATVTTSTPQCDESDDTGSWSGAPC